MGTYTGKVMSLAASGVLTGMTNAAEWMVPTDRGVLVFQVGGSGTQQAIRHYQLFASPGFTVPLATPVLLDEVHPVDVVTGYPVGEAMFFPGTYYSNQHLGRIAMLLYPYDWYYASAETPQLYTVYTDGAGAIVMDHWPSYIHAGSVDDPLTGRTQGPSVSGLWLAQDADGAWCVTTRVTMTSQSGGVPTAHVFVDTFVDSGGTQARRDRWHVVGADTTPPTAASVVATTGKSLLTLSGWPGAASLSLAWLNGALLDGPDTTMTLGESVSPGRPWYPLAWGRDGVFLADSASFVMVDYGTAGVQVQAAALSYGLTDDQGLIPSTLSLGVETGPHGDEPELSKQAWINGHSHLGMLSLAGEYALFDIDDASACTFTPGSEASTAYQLIPLGARGMLVMSETPGVYTNAKYAQFALYSPPQVQGPTGPTGPTPPVPEPVDVGMDVPTLVSKARAGVMTGVMRDPVYDPVPAPGSVPATSSNLPIDSVTWTVPEYRVVNGLPVTYGWGTVDAGPDTSVLLDTEVVALGPPPGSVDIGATNRWLPVAGSLAGGIWTPQVDGGARWTAALGNAVLDDELPWWRNGGMYDGGAVSLNGDDYLNSADFDMTGPYTTILVVAVINAPTTRGKHSAVIGTGPLVPAWDPTSGDVELRYTPAGGVSTWSGSRISERYTKAGFVRERQPVLIGFSYRSDLNVWVTVVMDTRLVLTPLKLLRTVPSGNVRIGVSLSDLDAIMDMDILEVAHFSFPMFWPNPESPKHRRVWSPYIMNRLARTAAKLDYIYGITKP